MGVVPNGSAGVTPGVAGALGQTGTSTLKGRTQTSVTNTLKGDVATPSNPGGSIGGSWGDVFNFGGLLGAVNQKADENNELIQVQGQQLADLADFVGTGTTTPMYASTGGRDLVTFPDTMMHPVPVLTTGSVSTHSHSYDPTGSSSFATTSFDGAHSHTLSTVAPYFSQGSGFADFAFMRGGRDTETPLEVVRIITGADAGLFPINAWYLGIYVLRTSDNVMVKLWDSGNIASVLTSQRQRYHIATGMTQAAQPDQVLAVASLQIAPGIGQKPRGLGCIFQTGISEQAGTIPPARHAYVTGQSTLPGGVGINAGFFNWDKTKLMWAALGESAT